MTLRVSSVLLVLFLFIYWWSSHSVAQAKAWPVVEAVVTSCRVVSSERPSLARGVSAIVSDRLEIRYRYVVAEHSYISKRFYRYGDPDPFEAVKKYPTGKHFEAHYNPDDPAQAVVEPGYPDRKAMIASVICFAVGMGVKIWTLLRDRPVA